MYHGLSNGFLYSAFKIEATFINDIAQPKSVTGTAFFVQNKAEQICLVTNRHVVDLAYQATDPNCKRFKLEGIRIRGKQLDKTSNLPTQHQSMNILRPRYNLRYSGVYENDVACIVAPKISSVDSSENCRVDFLIPHSLIADDTRISSKLTICDFVAFPGYPPWHDKRAERPILRTGTISSDPRFDYSHSRDYLGALIAYEAFSFGGSSGSPVFALEKGLKPGLGISFSGYRELMMIGINAGHLWHEEKGKESHSGISYMYKSSAILDIIDA